jgi:hypothetical protein
MQSRQQLIKESILKGCPCTVIFHPFGSSFGCFDSNLASMDIGQHIVNNNDLTNRK